MVDASPEPPAPGGAQVPVYRWLAFVLGALLCIASAAYLYERRRRTALQRAAPPGPAPAPPAVLAPVLARIAAANADLESFAYVTSRELVDPLRHAAAYLDLIDRRLPAEDHEPLGEYVTTARTNVARMHHHLAEVLAFSHVHREVRLAPKRISLPHLLRQLAAALREAHPERVIDVRIDGEGEVLAPVAPLRQAFEQLLGNAALYNEHPVVRIGLTVRRINDRVRVEVSDNGIGIPAEHHERVFALFKRLHTVDAYAGTGLGLALVRRIVGSLGGEVRVASAPGNGSVFTVTLPVDTTPVVRMMAAHAEV